MKIFTDLSQIRLSVSLRLTTRVRWLISFTSHETLLDEYFQMIYKSINIEEKRGTHQIAYVFQIVIVS